MKFGRALIDPDRIIRDAGISEGMHVADLGCGRTGHIVLPMAKAVGERGAVYAVDLMKDNLQVIEGFCSMNGLCNLFPVWGDMERADGVRVPDGSLDVAFLINNLSLIQSHRALADEVRRLLKPKGRFIVIDWKKRFPHPVKPSTQQLFDLNDAELMFTRLGLRKVDELPVSQSHWGLVLAR